MTNKVLRVENGDVRGATNAYLRGLLSQKKVDALLVMQDTPSGASSFPVLVSEPGKLHANIFAPVLPTSTATAVSKLTRIKAAGRTIGVVARSCQLRALVELVKLNQARMDNIVLIGMDCPGTFDVNQFSELAKSDPTKMVLEGYENEGKLPLRSACAVCADPVPEGADIVIGIFGMDVKNQVLVQARNPKGERLVDGLADAGDLSTREEATRRIRERRAKAKDAFIKEHARIKGIDALAEFFDKCVNCHNCMKACPICYCHECLFESNVLDMAADSFVKKADARGLFKMPSDSLLFHITRMNHMIVSCVECGLCEQACPSRIPLMEVIIPVAEAAQKEFGYVPGKDPEEKTPMVVFKEDEFHEVGESKDGCC